MFSETKKTRKREEDREAKNEVCDNNIVDNTVTYCPNVNNDNNNEVNNNEENIKRRTVTSLQRTRSVLSNTSRKLSTTRAQQSYLDEQLRGVGQAFNELLRTMVGYVEHCTKQHDRDRDKDTDKPKPTPPRYGF